MAKPKRRRIPPPAVSVFDESARVKTKLARLRLAKHYYSTAPQLELRGGILVCAVKKS